MQKLGEIIIVAGIVAIPLLPFSVVAIALIVERLVFWYRINKRQKRVVRDALNLYRDDPTLAQQQLKRHINLPIARIFLQAIALDKAAPEEFVSL